MAIAQHHEVSEAEYLRLALADGNGRWELYDGRLRKKPAMSVEHGDTMTRLVGTLWIQIDENEYRVRVDHARLRRSARNYFVPDIAVVPAAAVRALREQPGSLDAYAVPALLVVEIWSPSTGGYDIAAKLPQYQARGDLEIWYLHPYERTLTAWRRQSDGSYTETTSAGGTVASTALPGVVVDLDRLFAP